MKSVIDWWCCGQKRRRAMTMGGSQVLLRRGEHTHTTTTSMWGIHTYYVPPEHGGAYTYPQHLNVGNTHIPPQRYGEYTNTHTTTWGNTHTTTTMWGTHTATTTTWRAYTNLQLVDKLINRIVKGICEEAVGWYWTKTTRKKEKVCPQCNCSSPAVT